ncbi:MAG: hypothetical protein E7301_11365 [Butyrivibrio sp.]|nr:hypothetical protein [Butyrivibrio sp.]
MKCPNCGQEINEGHLYCDKCGTEINFVPEFDPEVENRIKESLSGVAKQLEDEDAFKTKKLPKIQDDNDEFKKHIPLYIGGVVIFLAAVFSFLFLSGRSSAENLEQQAEKYYVEGNYDKAITTLEKALSETSEDDAATRSGILFKIYGYQHEAGYESDAEKTLLTLSDGNVFDEETVTAAIEDLVNYYEASKEYQKIHDLVSQTSIEPVKQKYSMFLPAAPSFSMADGEYNEVINVAITSKSDGEIYYTVNGDEPGTNSIKYTDELILEEEGDYDIKAVLINSYGIASDVTSAFYMLENVGPAEPEIMEDSGEYSQATMIVAVCDTGCTIYYTTDGTDPDITSKQYTTPISMPLGDSTFKFVAADEEGRLSEIVEKNYHLSYTKLVSVEQARANIIATLVKLDILLDSTGKVRSEEGHFDYVYDREQDITGSGNYYIFKETHVYNDGTTNETGLLYAVNSHDGKVNRLGYDSSGNFTLINISNR